MIFDNIICFIKLKLLYNSQISKNMERRDFLNCVFLIFCLEKYIYI